MDEMRPLSDEEIDASLTDEIARRDGYKDANMLRKALKLGDLAGRWRRTKVDEDVQAYHRLFAELIEEGWNPHLLTEEEALPERLMPELPPQWRRQAQSKR